MVTAIRCVRHAAHDGRRDAAMIEDVLDEIETALALLSEIEQGVLLRTTQAIARRLQEAGQVKV